MADQDIPIDIHASKLLDWLLTRRHVNKDYQASLNLIREKITDAIQDMPAHPKIKNLLAGTQLNYFICKQILEVLKETEADSKNIFGYYSSQRMKDWQEIIKLYEKDNVYMAEAALLLNRNVNFEVPSIRKQVNKHQSNSDEFVRKSGDAIKQANKLKIEYQAIADRLGIKGKDIHNEFQELIQDLPKILEEIVQDLPKMKEALDYYQEFLQFTQKRNIPNFMPVSNYLLKKGNTTYCEYKTGKSISERSHLTRKSSSNDDQLDIEVLDREDTGSSSPSNGNGDFVHIEKDECLTDDGGEINWDIETVEEPFVSSVTSESVDNVSVMTKSVRENEFSTVLEHDVTRNTFINELHEMEGFFDQRIFQLKQEEHILSANQFQGAPSLLQMTSIEKLNTLLKQIEKILTCMTNEKINLLFMMRDDYKYIDRTANKMLLKLEQAEKLVQKSKVLEERAKEELQAAEKLKPEISVYINRTKELQRLIEGEISKKHKNRVVNIMGGYQIL